VWRKPGKELRNIIFVHRSNMTMVPWWFCLHGSNRSGKSSFYRRHHEQKLLRKHSSRTSNSQGWKTWNLRKLCSLPRQWLKTFFTFTRQWCLYNCSKVIKTPPQSPGLNVIDNLWAKLEREIRNHSISNKEDLKKALTE